MKINPLALFAIILSLVGCHGGPDKPFVSVECVGGELEIRLFVPPLYVGRLFLDDKTIGIFKAGHHTVIQAKPSPGEHTAAVHYKFFGPGFRVYGETFVREVTFIVDGPELTSEYFLCPIEGAAAPPDYLLRLDEWNLGEAPVTFDGDNVMFRTYEDGTAIISGQVRARRGASGVYKLDVTLMELGEEDGLTLYDIAIGWLTNVDNPHDVTELVGHGPPARVGFGGNGNLGFSGWVNYTRSNGSLDEHIAVSGLLGDLRLGSCADE